MKKCVLLFSLCAMSALAGEMTGYISDSTCGAGNAKSTKEAEECAKTCVKNGAEPVFVSEKDQKVYKLADKTKVMPHVGHKVVVSGEIKGDTIQVASVKMAS